MLKGRADYIIKQASQEVLVVEAKKTNVALMEEEGRQAVSYAYHRKIKFAVLTNFKYLRVYHALSNIKDIDKNLLKVNKEYFRLSFDEFLSKFDILWLLSKESFEKGEINKLLSSKDEKLNKPIDAHILEDLLNIRNLLSKELKSKKNYLTQEEIDEVVQIFIDRLIFIRSVEDREIESQNYLKSLESDVRQQRVKLQLFPYLLEEFEKFNKKYDSKLFEKGLLEKEGSFSDDVLRKVILTLYFGSQNNQERYLFDQIPGDLFGSIYEQYLGTILQGTEKRVTLDSASGKRKKMGIYYTPAYIVDYIVKNTVGEYIKSMDIDQILDVNVCDPACGSGSFLTRAYEEICNKIEELLKNGERSKKWSSFSNYNDKLGFNQKTTILANCIYGVDLDEKAVELARLNLLLKVLEHEGPETKVSKLPELFQIRCGNSLIDDAKISDKAFNWQAQFKDVFANGGFDVIVGNPPYIRNRDLKGLDKKVMNTKFISADGQYDLYQLFFELSINLLKNKGLLGFITSNKYATADYGKKIRKFILEKSKILSIIDVSNIQIFKEASTYPYILTLKKDNNNLDNNILTSKIIIPSDLEEKELIKIQQNMISKNKDSVFNLELVDSNFLNKLRENSIVLGDLCDIRETIHTGNIRKKVLFNEKKDVNCKMVVGGRDISRYFIKWNGKWILYDPSIINKGKKEYGNFPNRKYFDNPKILIRDISLRLTATYDDTGLYSLNTLYSVIIKKDDHKINLKYVLGIVNSKLIDYFIKIQFSGSHVRGGYLRFKPMFTKQIPVSLPSSSQEKKIVSLVDQMLSLQKKYHDSKTIGGEKERLKQQIDNIDYEIDQEIYKLYDLTPEEIKIVEESLK